MRWFRRWFPKVARRRCSRPIRPGLEILEDRRLLALNPFLATPTLIGPSGVAPPLPTFSWNAVAGAVKYDLWVGDVSTQQVVANGAVSGTSWTPSTALANGNIYQWEVQAVDSSGNTGPWSAVAQFTDSNLPVPALVAPTGSATVQPTFSWTAVTGAASYDLVLQDQSTGQSSQQTGLKSTTFTPSSPLTVDDTYAWSVNAVDSKGNSGPSSAPLTFAVTNLTAPTLISPSGPAVPQPVFTWNALAGAVSYNLWLTNKNTGQVLNPTGITATTWTPGTALAQGNTYTWWVQGVDSNGIAGPWSAPLTFSEAVLPAPALIAPSGTAGPLPTFTWNAVFGADHYDIWVQDLSTNQVLRNTSVGGTSWSPTSPLIQQDSYSWWVRAIDPNGNAGQWSSGLTFVVQELAAPTTIAPSGSAVTLPTFSWNAVPLASQYDIWVQDANTGQVLRDQSVTGTTWTPASPLTQGDHYNWWVRAIDSIGSPGPWSATQSFTVAKLPAPTLIGPTGSINTPQPTLSWNAVTGASRYDIWLQDMNTGLIQRDQNVTATTWTPPNALGRGDIYQWWVRAIDSVGSPGPWSATGKFSESLLPAPSLISPSVSTSTLPTFSWNAVTSADHYDIWIQDMRTGVVIRNTGVVGTTWTPPLGPGQGPLVQGDPYLWWVRAVDSSGSPGLWSSSLSFAVASLAAPTLIGPSLSATVQPTFSWNAVDGADHYDIWVQDGKTGQVVRNQDVTGTTWGSATSLTLGDSYTWWVRAIDSVNSPGPWSAGLSFTVYVLAAPTLIGPSGPSFSLPTFGWNAVSGASQYAIWVQDLKTGAVLQDTTVTGTTWTPAVALVVGDHYRWWVRAFNSSGAAGAWSTSLDLLVAPSASGVSSAVHS
jgi:predicted phage tail protein